MNGIGSRTLSHLRAVVLIIVNIAVAPREILAHP